MVGVGAARIELNETDAPLHESPGQQALAAKHAALGIVHAIEIQRRSRFVAQVRCLGRGGLHPESQFVAGDPRFEIRVVAAQRDVQW